MAASRRSREMLYVIERIEISSLANSFSKNLKPNQSLFHVLVIIDKAYTIAKASLSLVVPSKMIEIC